MDAVGSGENEMARVDVNAVVNGEDSPCVDAVARVDVAYDSYGAVDCHVKTHVPFEYSFSC